jgi:hypothetical protein
MRRIVLALLFTSVLIGSFISPASIKADDIKLPDDSKAWLENPTYKAPITTKIENNKYEVNISNEIVTVGKGTDTFTPEITLYRWDKEVYVKLGEPIVNGNALSQKNAGTTITANTIDWASKDIEFQFYPVAQDSQNELGSFEYNIIIANSKAGTNQILSSISFPITSSGLGFYYQPELTQAEKNAGNIRPENVVGSYAVYHLDKRDHETGKINYGTGKAFHIYRPQLIDNAGNTIYADLSIANGYLTIDYSKIQDWLSKAKYPIKQTAGLTFGYTTNGGSWEGTYAEGYAFAQFGTPASTGTVDDIKAYTLGHSGGASNYLKAIVIDTSYNLLSNGVGGTVEVPIDNTPATRTMTYSTKPSVTASTSYGAGIVLNNNGGWSVAYDGVTDGVHNSFRDSTNSYSTPENLGSPTDVYNYKYSIYADYTAGGGGSSPTVTTQAASSVEGTTATGNGNVTDAGGSNITEKGIAVCLASHSETPDTGDTTFHEHPNNQTTGAYTESATGLSTGTAYHFRAYAINTTGTGYGSTVDVLTKPAAPTNVAATDGTDTTKVVVTWTKSTGATAYKVYEGSNLLDTLGDVATYDDSAAGAPTITPGTAAATDGTNAAYVTLSVAGESASNGASRTYKVTAGNATGYSGDSSTDTGYRGTTTLTYAWQRSAADSDASYSAIGGGTTDPYNDTAAPAPLITAGASVATDGSSTANVGLSLSGTSVADGAGRYFKCVISMTGASNQTTTVNRGYRVATALTYQWNRSAADSDASYSTIGGATSSTYNDTAAPAPTITAGTAAATDGTNSAYVTLSVAGEAANNGAGRYFTCTLVSTSASNTPATATANRGYRGVGGLTYAWQRSAADSDAAYSANGGTTDPYNDTGAPADGNGRYFKCLLDATGAAQAATTADRGYRQAYDIANAPDTKAFSIVAESTTYYAKGSAPSNPVVDGDCTYAITNNGSVPIDVSITGNNFTGGVGWTLGANVGSNVVKITVYKTGDNPASGVVLTTGGQAFISNLAAAGHTHWDFRFDTGTFTDGVAKSTTIRLTSTVH